MFLAYDPLEFYNGLFSTEGGFWFCMFFGAAILFIQIVLRFKKTMKEIEQDRDGESEH